MKKITILVIFLFARALHSQKDNTLFWEISGNEKMASSLDSLSRTGSVFSAVGAAHLAGE